jgi:hypothetical protein
MPIAVGQNSVKSAFKFGPRNGCCTILVVERSKDMRIELITVGFIGRRRLWLNFV